MQVAHADTASRLLAMHVTVPRVLQHPAVFDKASTVSTDFYDDGCVLHVQPAKTSCNSLHIQTQLFFGSSPLLAMVTCVLGLPELLPSASIFLTRSMPFRTAQPNNIHKGPDAVNGFCCCSSVFAILGFLDVSLCSQVNTCFANLHAAQHSSLHVSLTIALHKTHVAKAKTSSPTW